MNKLIKTIINFSPLVFSLIFVFIFPLLLSALLLTNNAFELVKAVYLWPAVLILFFLTLIKILVFKIDIKKYFYNYFFVGILIVLLLLFLNTIFVASDFNLALFGDYYRRQGFFTLLAFLIFFILTTINLLLIDSYKKFINYFLFSASLSGFLAAIYGLVQYLGFDIFTWQEPVAYSRVISTIGQPNFLASFLILSLSASLALIYRLKNFYWRLFLVIVSFFHLLTIVLTGSRAAFLALFLVAIISFFVFFKKRKMKIVFAISVVLAFLFSIYFQVGFNYNLNTGSTLARLNFYQASIDAISDKKYLGYGIEQAGDAFVSYYQPDWALFSSVNSYPDRAHNLFLDISLNFGLLGLFILITVFIYFFYNLVYKNKNKKKWNIIIILGLIAYLLSLMFSFPSLADSLYFFLLLAIILASYLKRQKQSSIRFEKYKLSSIFLLSLLFLNAFFIYISLNNSINTIKADHYFFKCQKLLAKDELEAFDLCLQAERLSKDKVVKDYYQQFNLNFLVDNYSFIENKNKYLYNYLNKHYYLLKSDNYSSKFTKAKLACVLKKDDYKDQFNSLIAQSPKRPAVYQAKANCYFYLNNYKQAIKNYQLALNYLPDINDKRLGLDHKKTLKHYSYVLFYALGQSQFQLNNLEESIEHFKQAYYNYSQDYSLWKNIAQANYQLGNYKEAIDNYLFVWQNEKENYIWPQKISEIYYNLDNKEKSALYSKKAKNLINN